MLPSCTVTSYTLSPVARSDPHEHIATDPARAPQSQWQHPRRTSPVQALLALTCFFGPDLTCPNQPTTVTRWELDRARPDPDHRDPDPIQAWWP
jgi:hypothetical protein